MNFLEVGVFQKEIFTLSVRSSKAKDVKKSPSSGVLENVYKSDCGSIRTQVKERKETTINVIILLRGERSREGRL